VSELSQRPSAIALTVVLFIIIFLVGVESVWALSVTPNSPVADQPFTVSGLVTITSSTISLIVGHGSCNSLGTPVYSVIVSGYFDVTVPGQSAGNYYAALPTSCVGFTVISAAIPEYPFGLLILAIFIVIAYGLIKLRTRSREEIGHNVQVFGNGFFSTTIAISVLHDIWLRDNQK